MTWIIVTIIAYLFGAGANILDKFLLGSKRFSSAPVYAFYIGIFGLTSFIFAPLGLSVPVFSSLMLCFFAGILFLVGIMMLYFAIEKAEASRVVPVVGAVLPIVTFLIAYFWQAESFTLGQIFGMSMLILGGLLISFDLPLKLGKKKFFAGFYWAIGAGIFLAVTYLIFKEISLSENFATWYIWTRVGSTIGAIGLLMMPAWRADIISSFHSAKKNKKHAYTTGYLFIANKIMGGASTFLFNFAITLGSVTMINSLVSLQYVFVLILAWLLSKKYHRVFQEKLYFWDWAQKIGAIFIIAIGAVWIYLK